MHGPKKKKRHTGETEVSMAVGNRNSNNNNNNNNSNNNSNDSNKAAAWRTEYTKHIPWLVAAQSQLSWPPRALYNISISIRPLIINNDSNKAAAWRTEYTNTSLGFLLHKADFLGHHAHYTISVSVSDH
jgi:hypothetical protein